MPAHPTRRDDQSVHEMMEPASYQIRVRGRLGETLLGAFPTLHAEVRAGETVLTGVLRDEAALHGVLAQIEGFGLVLLELRRDEPPPNTASKVRSIQATTTHPDDVESADG